MAADDDAGQKQGKTGGKKHAAVKTMRQAHRPIFTGKCRVVQESRSIWILPRESLSNLGIGDIFDNFMILPATNSRRRRPWFQAVVQALLLAGWLFSADGVLPGLLTMLAQCEEAHLVEVRAESSGRVRLHLIDANPDSDEEENHWMTRLLLAFVGESPLQGPAHEMAFEDLDEAIRHQAVAAMPPVWRVCKEPASPNKARVLLMQHPRLWTVTRIPAAHVTNAGGLLKASRCVLVC